jgi:hypothetical protein
MSIGSLRPGWFDDYLSHTGEKGWDLPGSSAAPTPVQLPACEARAPHLCLAEGCREHAMV